MLFFCKRLLFYILVIIGLVPHSTWALESRLTLKLDHINVADAVRLVATFLGQNVILSPQINGTTSLQLSNALPRQAFNLLLAANGLAAWQEGNTWFIATQDELFKRKEGLLKWQDIWDENAPLHMQYWQIKYAKAQEVAHLLQDEHTSFLSKRGRIQVDVRTNSIFVQDSAPHLRRTQELIRHLDVPAQQISIDAKLVSVDTDCERDLGINFATTVGVENNGFNSNKSFSDGPGQYSIAVANLADGSLLNIKLSALESAGKAELISSPSLFSANLQPASIEAGEEIPYQETSESGGTAVVFKKAVLGLKVTPQLLPGRNILLQLQINQDRPSSKMVLGMPTISTRQITTNILVKSGQTRVLGGIYEINNEVGERRLPYINRIPLLGWLFKQRSSQKNKRELLIFVTPKIIEREI